MHMYVYMYTCIHLYTQITVNIYIYMHEFVHVYHSTTLRVHAKKSLARRSSLHSGDIHTYKYRHVYVCIHVYAPARCWVLTRRVRSPVAAVCILVT